MSTSTSTVTSGPVSPQSPPLNRKNHSNPNKKVERGLSNYIQERQLSK